MSKIVYRYFIGLALFIVMVYYMTTIHGLSGSQINKPSILEEKINFCEEIAEKSVASLPTMLEFQRLEMVARKANVMNQCMRDHGFIENPAWLNYATNLAQDDAIKQGISSDEALQNLKKKDMYLLKLQKNIPAYWINFNALPKN
jgi:hypothetical protein